MNKKAAPTIPALPRIYPSKYSLCHLGPDVIGEEPWVLLLLLIGNVDGQVLYLTEAHYLCQR